MREENLECGMSLCLSLLFKKVQSHGAVVRATGEEKFGGNQTSDLTSHQWLTRAGLHSALALACAVAVCLFQLCHAWLFLYEKSFTTAFLK